MSILLTLSDPNSLSEFQYTDHVEGMGTDEREHMVWV